MKIWRVPYPKFGYGPGLARVAAIAKRLGVSLSGFGASGVVIVGSNGKGSTAAMCAALMRQARAPLGLFTSPHLMDLNERFNIDGEDISDEELGQHWRRVATAIESEGLANTIGGFEFLFLIAADWFNARGCAFTVWEAGIGGRLDPVRTLDAARVGLTSLDLEHTALLGDTLEEIAREKVDAAPDAGRVFVSQACAAQRDAIEAHAALRNVQVRWVDADALGAFDAPLPGDFQRDNAALALALARDAAPLAEDAIRAGFAFTRWPGRLEILEESPLTIIDVGHTPAAIRLALEGFAAMRGARPAVLVCGASADKDVGQIISALAPAFERIICVAARHKGAPAAEIAAHANAANPHAEIVLAESVTEARALALAKAKNGAIYVAGGLFLAAEFKAVHSGRDPATLAFF